MKRESTGFVKTLGVYFTIAFAALQALDVLLERLGLPERLFTQASVAVVLFLPAAVAIGLIRRLLAEEDPPSRAASTAPGHVRRQAEIGAPRVGVGEGGNASAARRVGEADVAAVHLRLARLYETRGDEERAAEHYERFLKLVEVDATTGTDRP